MSYFSIVEKIIKLYFIFEKTIVTLNINAIFSFSFADCLLAMII